MEMNKKQTILIVEDEAVFRLIYRGVLENDGYQVIESANGRDGWETIQLKKPDLILLDLILPEMSGYELLQKVRADKTAKNIPVIIFSVMGAESDIQKALELGANYYRVKGASSPSDILTQIHESLKK